MAQVYVDPSLASASGTGSSGDPFGDLQYALDNTTQGTNGDQFNIKSGTDEVLAAGLSLATYGTPTSTKPLLLKGYSSVADDGGIGGIDCNASYSLFAVTTLDYIGLWDLEIHNGGSQNIVELDADIMVIDCEIHNTTGNGITVGRNCEVMGCYVHNVGNYGIRVTNNSFIAFNYLENGSNDFAAAISMAFGAFIYGNIIKVDGATDGIITSSDSGIIMNNTIYGGGSSGRGLEINNHDFVIMNNYAEGFTGSPGRGILLATGTVTHIYHNNYYYNNLTNEAKNGTIVSESGNTSLSASGLVDPANDDFRANARLRANGWPSEFPQLAAQMYIDVGALSRKESRYIPKIYRV